jgi:aspartyl/asparaginyl beta-hydroxylase (cupin superfamily)
MRCLLAKLMPGSIIRMHVDNGDYFLQTLRIHVPVVSDPSVAMVSDDRVYTMQPGEAWALNNSTYHGVLSAWTQPRIHLICDFQPSEALCALVRAGERELGRRNDAILERVKYGA